MTYKPDPIQEPVDVFVLSHSGPEPVFDTVMQDFLLASHREANERLAESQMVEMASLGQNAPWLYRLTFRTRGLARTSDGVIQPSERHTIAFRLLPDYLRSVNRFATLAYIEPREPAPFHPNIQPHTGAICLEVYPGEPVIEVVQSLHDLLRWRIRELREDHAFSHEACRYGREHITAPLDDRPLLGRHWKLEVLPEETRS